MKRRSFLKGLLAAASVPLVPSLAYGLQEEKVLGLRAEDVMPFLKEHYSDRVVSSLVFGDRPTWDFVPKRTSA